MVTTIWGGHCEVRSYEWTAGEDSEMGIFLRYRHNFISQLTEKRIFIYILLL
jgi:hypothetical protein